MSGAVLSQLREIDDLSYQFDYIINLTYFPKIFVGLRMMSVSRYDICTYSHSDDVYHAEQDSGTRWRRK